MDLYLTLAWLDTVGAIDRGWKEMNNHLLIESDGVLFRGNSYYFPIESNSYYFRIEFWNVKTLEWETYRGRVPKGPAWGNIVSEAEAEKLKGLT